MNKSLVLQTWGNIFQKQKKQQLVKEVPKSFWLGFFLLTVNFFIFFSYLLGVNNYSAVGYEIKQLQQSIVEKTEESKKLSLQIAESSSILNLQTDLINSNFVSAGTPQFLREPIFTQK